MVGGVVVIQGVGGMAVKLRSALMKATASSPAAVNSSRLERGSRLWQSYAAVIYVCTQGLVQKTDRAVIVMLML